MVITDGIPSDGQDAERNIRTSRDRHPQPVPDGADFPHWVALADAWELGPALMRRMRKAIVLG